MDGDPGPAGLVRLPAGSACTVDGCGNPNVARGYCEMHRWRMRAHGEPGSPVQVKQRHRVQPEKCIIEGCERLTKTGTNYGARGMCKLHYERIRRTGEPGPAEPIYVKGRVKPRGDGYRRIHVGNGRRVLEHVHVMEQILGRRLAPGENVHHKNGVKDDNDPANLELWYVMQPTGQRIEDLIAFVVGHYRAEVERALKEELWRVTRRRTAARRPATRSTAGTASSPKGPARISR